MESRIPVIREHLDICWAFTKAKYARSNLHRADWANRSYCLSAGFCRHTTLFLQRLLAKIGHGQWKCAGGVCFDHQEGHYAAHWWLDKDGVILDLTADQFDSAHVVLCEATHPNYRRSDERSTQARIRELTGVVRQWEGQCFQFWDDKDVTDLIASSYASLLNPK